MVGKNTKVMVISQSVNLLFTFLVLLITSTHFPYWNGKIGALAQSVGMVAELGILIFILFKFEKKVNNRLIGSNKRKYING